MSAPAISSATPAPVPAGAAPAATPAPVDPAAVPEKKKRTRRVHTKETVAAHFLLLRGMIEAQIKELHDKSEKGSKFLRTVNKHVRELSDETRRAFNTKVKVKRENAKPSGFLKPTAISAELAVFIGKPADTLISRVDVTKLICAYIKEHKLYKESDKRVILPNATLKALLNYPKLETDPPLTYFELQRVIQPLFPKKEQAPAPAVKVESS